MRSVAYGRGQSGVLELRFIATNAEWHGAQILVLDCGAHARSMAGRHHLTTPHPSRLPVHVRLTSAYAAGVASPDECRIGDARAMIPPVTGNGMSLALESAELAIAPLVDWAQDRREWRDVCAEIQSRYDKAFRGRLGRARWLQRGLFSRMIGRWVMPIAEHSDGVWRLLFAATR